MEPTVSVIVTCYNHERYIKQCLLSIFHQSYSNIALTVIDDGSQDTSAAIIQEVLGGSPFSDTAFLRQENAGVCVTRNRGLEAASGDFVLFVDSDNYLPTDYIEKMVNHAQEHQADIVYGDLWDFTENQPYVKSRPFQLTALLENNYIDNCSLLRRSKIGEARYDLALNRKFLEDWDFLLNLILNQQMVASYAEDVRLNYRILADSTSRRDNHTQRAAFYDVYFYILAKHVSHYSDEVFQAITNNTMILEDRLGDLTDHLAKLTNYIQVLENGPEDYQARMRRLTSEVAILQREKEELLHSRSYRLGNGLIRPLKGGVRLVRNPRLAKPLVKRVLAKGKRTLKKLPAPTRYLYRPYRWLQRKENNYLNPKRQLIYVIYEDQPALQTYKKLFLASLAPLCQEVLIVVNGRLDSADIQELENYGEVYCRENSGYDTAAFRAGLLKLGRERLEAWDQLLLVNDTNIGPFADFEKTFKKMAAKRLDFWGISYGEEQPDITGVNPYGYIPLHLQSYFLVIEKSLLQSDSFWQYWQQLTDTDSREKAIGYHETVFTRHFTDLGFKSAALLDHNRDSAMYIHPLTMVKKGIPLVKFSAFTNDSDDKFLWQGLKRKSEIPALLRYIKEETTFPMTVIEEVQAVIKKKDQRREVLIIDGVENRIPQCTRYRVLNKAQQLRSLGYPVKVVDQSQFRLSDAQQAQVIIIYRCSITPLLTELVSVAHHFGRRVLYDIDDLVIDPKYTDQLAYTKGLSPSAKADYDENVRSYGEMLALCDGAITTTARLQTELSHYRTPVLMNRNLASAELVTLSEGVEHQYPAQDEKVRIGYFSGSITHNENFELVKPALVKLMGEIPTVELHIVGYLELPPELQPFHDRIVTHDYVQWEQLPALISQVDINLAPLTNTVFNQAKSEIKWLEAALVKVPTCASRLGAFEEMVFDGVTGILVSDDQWEASLRELITNPEKRQQIAEAAYKKVMADCVTTGHTDELTAFVKAAFATEREEK